jgi:hypothetical protein
MLLIFAGGCGVTFCQQHCFRRNVFGPMDGAFAA